MSDNEAVRRECGFTNDPVWLERAIAWREAAVRDGWSIEPTYKQHESQERASSLWKQGFHALILTRDNEAKHLTYRYEAQVSVWAPDGLAIHPPDVYDWAAINAAVRQCNACGKKDVATQRYSFAGRCCAECLPAMRAKHERPGWTN